MRYPLGDYDAPAATSLLPADGGLDPAVGVDLTYFTGRNGFAKGSAPMAGDGPTWIGGAVVVKDAQGREQMFTGYVKIKPPLETYRRGLARWNDEANAFEHVADFPMDSPMVPLVPMGHALVHQDGGVEYVYYCVPMPLVRVRATAEAVADPSAYEAYTCLKEGGSLDKPELDRAADGTLRYAWRRQTPAVGQAEQKKFVEQGIMRPDEGLLQLRDRDTGKPILPHAGSTVWNEHRRRWIMIFSEYFGSSLLGEVRYAEADSPVGPWTYTVKVVTHNSYSFYNPKLHPYFDQEGGRKVYFEGTYTNSFSGNPTPTPRYEYNQVMYRLDLDDPRLALPVAVYREPGEIPCRFHMGVADRAAPPNWKHVALFALDRPIEARRWPCMLTRARASRGSRPTGPQPLRNRSSTAARRPTARPPHKHQPNGRADDSREVAPAAETPPALVPLYEFAEEQGERRAYSTDKDWTAPGFRRLEQPLCYVWRR